MTEQLRAAIVGGGIGGMAAAAALLSRGIEVSVFEQAAEIGEVGAGVMIFPNSLRQLERLGLGQALAEAGGRIGSGSSFYRKDGSFVAPVTITDSSGWNGLYGMHRADLLLALASLVPAGAIHVGHKCVGFEQDDRRARLTFANGNSFEADLVIAADGIQSALQKFVVEPSRPIHSGSLAYRGLLPRAEVPWWPDDAFEVWMGDGKHFLVFPVRGGAMINYVAFVPTSEETRESWSAPGNRDKLAAEFEGWDPRVTRLLERVETCFWWGLYDRAPLARWSNGRLALLGDAAHPMLPHLGQGANQAIEDGVALAAFLEGRRGSDVAGALKRYEIFRRSRTDIVQAESRRNGQRYDSRYESLEARDREIADSRELRRWIFDHDVEKEARNNLAGMAAASA